MRRDYAENLFLRRFDQILQSYKTCLCSSIKMNETMYFYFFFFFDDQSVEDPSKCMRAKFDTACLI